MNLPLQLWLAVSCVEGAELEPMWQASAKCDTAKVRGKVNKPPSVEASLTATAISVDDPPENFPGRRRLGSGASRAGLALHCLQQRLQPRF